ncbi:Cysteine proteinase [Venustampulla echinocandica]|uniref:Cysteine proteinase n=1 Tax=Venustampulla echinocandica TaxID=2656787 RepID=A0A370TK09_9HELO|nr:Cysteine proteinase [Venustampulla echinocandica]RDL35856.1 Cysteine proteinase [Venustampulla echinocandica]
MADTEAEEPQFTSLAARIAALKQQGVGTSAGGARQTTGKRPPPPLPPSANRPPLPTRTQTANNPPIASYGSSSTKQANNLPTGVRGTPLLPPPGVDRDRPQNRPSSPGNAANTPPLPSRPSGPPRLPNRKATEPSPSLPPRHGSTQMVRRDSNASTMSLSSTISALSLGQAPSSTSSVESQRKMPPPLDMAKLPPLPPSRRELEQRKAEEEARAPKIPLISVKSAPNVPLRPPPPVDRDQPPKMPPRPGGSPRMPPRPTSRNNTEEEKAPKQPPRRLPPPAIARSALSMGFGNKETPNPAPRPTPTFTRPAGPVVQELNAANFDSVVMSGKAAFVDFYAPFCKYCVDLEPIWKQLGEDFAFAHDRLVIAKIDVHEHKTFMSRFDIQEYPTMLYFDGHSETPQKCPFNPELAYLTKFLEGKSGIRAADGPKSNGVPPPINLSSKPSRSQIQAVQSRPAAPPPPSSGCLLCRDFSGPDGVAAQYPRQSLPKTHDITGYLADVLCGPFQSATDKARAIFTWLHHNIAYDTVAFFARTVNYGATPTDTIGSGLAVCGGYAGVFTAVALKAGLEAVMVTGHGKGYGFSALKPGDPIPPCKPTGHAWNAVRIDGGEWKLLDSCWGAGHLSDKAYKQKFTPTYFTAPNDEFGLKHFPSDEENFFRSDGRVLTWEEYIVGPVGAEQVEQYGAVSDHGLAPTSFAPPQKKIPVNSGETVRFQFSKACEHWDHEKNGQGKPYCMVLRINGVDGRKEDYVAFENNDFWWWADVPAKDLGAPGQKVNCYAVTTVNGKDARGMTRKEYLGKKGRCGMGFGGVCVWDLV